MFSIRLFLYQGPLRISSISWRRSAIFASRLFVGSAIRIVPPIISMNESPARRAALNSSVAFFVRSTS